MSNKLGRLKDMLEDKPHDSFLLFAMAKEQEKFNNLEEAINWYEKLKQAHPDYIGLYYHLAAAYAELEISTKAKETYEEGIRIAQRLKDTHSLSELQNAYMNFQLDL